MIGRLHKWLGVVLILPLLGWCLTGAIFLFQPGYGDAYTKLEPMFYPVQRVAMLPAAETWLEIRQVQTVLGSHLMAKTEGGWHQYDTDTLALRAPPLSAEVESLLEDAIRVDTERYGRSVSKTASGYVTETGVTLSFQWNTLSIEQHGKDRTLIDTLYAVHYLRWTGNRALDNVVAVFGLCCLLLTTLLGIKLLFSRSAAG